MRILRNLLSTVLLTSLPLAAYGGGLSLKDGLTAGSPKKSDRGRQVV